MPFLSKRFNFYGFTGIFVLILSITAFVLLLNASCTQQNNSTKLETIQIAGSITGFLLFVVSFYNIDIVLYLSKSIVYTIIATISLMGCVMLWGAYIAFSEPCNTVGLLRKNAFTAEDGYHIAVLDIFSCLMFFSTSATFTYRL